MSEKTYVPEEGTFQFKVVQYFITNPKDELSQAQLEAKFGKAAIHIHSLLGRAVEFKVLKRRQDDDLEWLYSLGTHPTGIAPDASKHPSLGPKASAASAVIPKKTRIHTGPAVWFSTEQLQQLPLQDDVPHPVSQGGRVKTDWSALFLRMKVGQSCELPLKVRATLGKAITNFAKAGLGEMSLRKVSETELRLWRIK